MWLWGFLIVALEHVWRRIEADAIMKGWNPIRGGGAAIVVPSSSRASRRTDSWRRSPRLIWQSSAMDAPVSTATTACYPRHPGAGMATTLRLAASTFCSPIPVRLEDQVKARICSSSLTGSQVRARQGQHGDFAQAPHRHSSGSPDAAAAVHRAVLATAQAGGRMASSSRVDPWDAYLSARRQWLRERCRIFGVVSMPEELSSLIPTPRRASCS